MNIGRDCLGKQGDIKEQFNDMTAPEPDAMPWQVDGVIYPAMLDDWHTAEGIDKRYYAGLIAFLMRDEENFDLDKSDIANGIFITTGGYFSSREVKWDSNNEILTVTSPKIGEISRFEVSPEHTEKLANKIYEVYVWERLNSLSEAELEEAGYTRHTQSWSGYTKTWFMPIDSCDTQEDR